MAGIRNPTAVPMILATERIASAVDRFILYHIHFID